jgi:hypothetical protein
MSALVGVGLCLGVLFLSGVGLLKFIDLFRSPQESDSTGTAGQSRRIEAMFRGTCRRCRKGVVAGMEIDYFPATKEVQHADCADARARLSSKVMTEALANVERAKGPASRRQVIAQALERLDDPTDQMKLLVEASRLEVTAVLDKADKLKTEVAKRRHLEEAIRTLRSDDVPDEMQLEQIQWLEDAIAALDGPKTISSIVTSRSQPLPPSGGGLGQGIPPADAAVYAALARMEEAKDAAARRAILRETLSTLPVDGQARTHLMVEASRVEVEAVLRKVETLKSPGVKRKHLTAALAELELDAVPDDLQREQAQWLKEELAKLERKGSDPA